MQDFFRRINRLANGRLRVRVGKHIIGANTFDRFLYLWLHKLGLMGRAERSFFQNQLRPGMTIVDVGANLGLYSLLFSELTSPGGRVFSFEPSPALFAQFSENIRRNGADNILAHPWAVGARRAHMALQQDPFNSGNNRLAENSRGVSVEVVPLDEIVGSVPVDWVKIDVQGWEPTVLAGMEKTITRNPELKIYFEFWPPGLRRAGFAPLNFLTSLNDQGFILRHPGQAHPLGRKEFESLSKTNTYLDLLACRS